MSKKTSTKKTASPKTGKTAIEQAKKNAKPVIAEIQKRVDDLEAQEATVETAIPSGPGEPIPTQDAPKPGDIGHGTPARKRHIGPGGKRIKAPKPEAPAKTKKVSLLDAAAAFLKMHRSNGHKTKDIVAAAPSLGWVPGAGKTPEASLYAAIIREIDAKGKESRFVKLDKGVFQASKSLIASEA